MTDNTPKVKPSDALEAFPTDRLLDMKFRQVEGTGRNKRVCMCPISVIADALGFNSRVYDRAERIYRQSMEEQDAARREELTHTYNKVVDYKGGNHNYILMFVKDHTGLTYSQIHEIFSLMFEGQKRTKEDWTRNAESTKSQIVSFLREKGL